MSYNARNVMLLKRKDMIGQRIKELRLINNLKQEDIANAAGVTITTYIKWEKEETEPKATQIFLICKKLNITVGSLFGLEGESESTILKANLKRIEMLSEKEQECLNQVIDAVLLKSQVEKVQNIK